MGKPPDDKLLATVRKGLKQAFPPVMAQLLRELVKPHPDFSDIAQVIGMDPVMSASILNLVNSPFYGLTQSVTSIERAAVVLGTKEILKIALSVSYMKQRPGGHAQKSEGSFDNWRLIVWSAIAAELIAERICPDQTDLAYLCTLLKDLSLLLVNHTEPKTLMVSESAPMVCLAEGQLDAERQKWGITHAELTIMALEQWGIPDLGCGCIADHHDMENLESHPALTQAVILATQSAELTGGCDRDPLLFVQFDMALQQRMGMDDEEIKEFRSICVQKFRSLLSILDLEEAEPDQRMYEHSVQSMQRFHFQSMEVNSVTGGLPGVARTVARHLSWNFDLHEWQLSLRAPVSDAWALFEPGEKEVVAQAETAELDSDLHWRYKKHRLLLIASGEKWGELRIRSGASDQEGLTELSLYVRFLSRAFEQYCMRQAVIESKAQTLDVLPVGVAQLDAEGRILELNASLFKLLNTAKRPKGCDMFECMDMPLVRDEWDKFLGDPEKTSFAKVICHPKTGKDTHCLFLSAHKEGDTILFLTEDLKEISELEAQALRHSEFMERLVGSMQDLVLTIDAKGTITFASPSHRKHLLGRNLFTLSRLPRADQNGWGAERLATQKAPLEISLQAKNGQMRPMECIFTRLGGTATEAPSYLMVGRDLSKVRRLEDKIKRQAVYDGLTELFNHYQFHALLEREIRRSRRTGHPVGLVFIDLDGFKAVNDTQGHQAGDKVLRKVAAALREQVRQGTDFPCRYGGDEFAVIAAESSAAGLHSLAERIKASVDSSLLGLVRLSMGIALQKPGESPGSLLKRADNASYIVKGKGGDGIAEG